MKNYHLTPYEQETIISWNNEEDTACVYTYDQRIGKRLRELSRKHPDVFVLKDRGAQRCVTFEMPKKLISIRQPYDEGRRKEQSIREKERVRKRGYVISRTEDQV